MTDTTPTSNGYGAGGVGTSVHGSNGKAPRRPSDPIVKVQPPRREDLQPSYAQNIHPDTEDAATHGWYGGMVNMLGACIGNLGAIPCCIVCPNPYKPVQQGNVGLVTKFGRFARAVDPGLVKVNPLSEQLIQVDVKIQIVGKSAQNSSQEPLKLKAYCGLRFCLKKGLLTAMFLSQRSPAKSA